MAGSVGQVSLPPVELAEFPILAQRVHGNRLAYLDNAATTQKPRSVIESMTHYYEHDNANVHRGVHLLSQRATDAFDAARVKLAQFIGAQNPNSVLWTKGCTEAINLVAQTWGLANLGPDKRILLSAMEHHANIVPWQMVAERTGVTITPIPVSDEGVLDIDWLRANLDETVALVGVKQICNALGTVNPIGEIATMAHAVGALILVDGAQALAHAPANVVADDLDFYAMSAHKAYGPTGVGALYVRPEILRDLAPYQGGGDMIRTVSWEGTTYNDPPNRFEAGTPNIAGVIGFGAALDFLTRIGIDRIHLHEESLLEYGTSALSAVPGLTLRGTAPCKAAILSFTLDGIHPHDLGTLLDGHGVAIRSGHHCCMPLMKRLGVPATARASLAVYNTQQDIDQLVFALHEAKRVFA